jgi:hypothetical protein
VGRVGQQVADDLVQAVAVGDHDVRGEVALDHQSGRVPLSLPGRQRQTCDRGQVRPVAAQLQSGRLRGAELAEVMDYTTRR